MEKNILIVGYGPVGAETAEQLKARDYKVTVAQRRSPKDLSDGLAFTPCDVLDRASVMSAFKGKDQVVISIGFAYDGKVWMKSWPLAMGNILAAAEATGARVVFIDNLYMYGPQDKPLTEDMPLTSFGAKPSTRSVITRMWQDAADAGAVKFAALRAPDFYGPGVSLSHFSNDVFNAIGDGKPAQLVMKPDLPHAFAYVPDIARAAVTLLEAPDADFGQAWHVPCAPVKTPRQMLGIAAQALGTKLRIQALPLALIPVIGVFVPMLRAITEMRFLFDRPYEVNADKFAKRFWGNATPFEVGIPKTALAARK
ncbi:NAD-dependent epimerase/dehydratase family protein [Aestuariivirga litoralis]|uniref:NAD-dependent epimerase/dehydratase family protein n=1 Tax=Aestuariivirga litoralis TaxID=2650924 RepID=UPI0018C8513A|nr:NAD-dependent epimerase/dehydratase family protein [Aestuariivirga litoralis]MBG1232861.1 NAD-dependent epimerase/dehydratase family protein [Aestuariivirga litoralis]